MRVSSAICLPTISGSAKPAGRAWRSQERRLGRKGRQPESGDGCFICQHHLGGAAGVANIDVRRGSGRWYAEAFHDVHPAAGHTMYSPPAAALSNRQYLWLAPTSFGCLPALFRRRAASCLPAYGSILFDVPASLPLLNAA